MGTAAKNELFAEDDMFVESAKECSQQAVQDSAKTNRDGFKKSQGRTVVRISSNQLLVVRISGNDDPMPGSRVPSLGAATNLMVRSADQGP